MTKRSGLCFLAILTLSISIFSCKSTKGLHYAKEVIDSTKVMSMAQVGIPTAVIQPYDLLLINVYGKGYDMTMMANNFGGLETAEKMQSSNSEALRPGYLVSPDGYIDLPLLGKLKVDGLSLKQLENDLTPRYAKIMLEPKVVVKFTSFKVTMLGAVKVSGPVTSQREKMSIFEALGLCGDVNVYAVKEKVKVMRIEDTTTTIGNLDLTSKDVFKSEYFYLKPNDVVYVPANGQEQTQQKVSTILPFVSITISVISILISLSIIK